MIETVIPPVVKRKKSTKLETRLQKSFLQVLLQEQVPVHVYLINGIKLQGHIESFDSTTILLKNGSSQLVYKRAVSTICPAENIAIGVS